MSHARVGWLLFVSLLVMAAVPLFVAFHLLESTLQTSLQLGFNADVVQVLEHSSSNLRTLGKLDPQHRENYRTQFEEVERLKQIYLAPELVRENIEKSLKLYFALGFGIAVLASLVVAAILSRRVANSYRTALEALLHEREQVRYLREMSSWQELAKMLAHEIKNPLTPIEVLVTALSKAYLSKDSQQFLAHLNDTQQMIAEELQHLKATVNRFSEFARLPQVQLARVDAMEWLHQYVKATSSTMTGAGVELRPLARTASLMTDLDTTLFKQVLANLIRNGIEANPGRNVNFTIEVLEEDRHVRLNVINDGMPVDAELATSIFDPYFSTHANKDNMGLGLAIVKKIILEHKGDIAYEEREGRPMFVITLPRAIT